MHPRATASVTLLAMLTLTCPLQAQQALVWSPPLDRDLLAADPTQLIALLGEHGYAASAASTDDLLEPARLSPGAVDLVIVPTRGVYPAEGIESLQEYLRQGGAVLSLGGLPFSRTLAQARGEWRLSEIPDHPPGAVRVVADFEAGLPQDLGYNSGGEQPMTCEVVAEDGGTALRAAVENLTAWEYVVVPLAEPSAASFTVLRFRARGDENTPLLGIEPNETDASRWKYVVPLSTQWQEYRIFIPHFLSYATEGRGGEGDYLHPERLAKISFGFARVMVGDGPHVFWLDDVELWQFEPAEPATVPRDESAVAATVRAYGRSQVKLPAQQQPPVVRLFSSARRFDAAGIVTAAGAGIMEGGQAVAGSWQGWAPAVPTGSGPAYDDVVMSRARTARVVPVLEATADGSAIGPAALVVHLHGGELAGGRLGCLTLDAPDILAEPLLVQAVMGMADYLTRRPRLVSLQPGFALGEEGPTMTLAAMVAAGASAADVRFAVSDLDGTQRWSETRRVSPGTTETIEAAVPADRFDVTHYRASVEVAADRQPVDRDEFVVDTRATMRALCEYFVAMQAEDGGISGIGFTDQRAVRGLLAMYELTGDERYRQAAIAWGEHELRIQRKDGGYRMGYGITSRGEECYVADGGEIAIGMARLVNYVPQERRQAYLDSLRAYYNYRESFRLPDGTITVGWVLNERWSTSGIDRQREEPFRSDRSVAFVCTCTLAGLSAWQRITGDPADRETAIRDARWYLREDVTAAGGSGEAAQWAHYLIDDPEIRAGFERRMRETLPAWVGRNPIWWIASGGRSAITLGTLSYFVTQIEDSPEVRMRIAEALYGMVSPHSPSSVHTVLAQAEEPNGDEWRYLCYSAASLAEVLEPLVTMRGFGE